MPEEARPFACVNLDTVGRLGDGELFVLNTDSAREWRFIFMRVGFTTGADIAQAVNEVRNNALLGGALAVLVLFVFLRDFRSTMIIGIAIPISIVGSFTVAFALGFTINILTLLALVGGCSMPCDQARRDAQRLKMTRRKLGLAGRIGRAFLESKLTPLIVVPRTPAPGPAFVVVAGAAPVARGRWCLRPGAGFSTRGSGRRPLAPYFPAAGFPAAGFSAAAFPPRARLPERFIVPVEAHQAPVRRDRRAADRPGSGQAGMPLEHLPLAAAQAYRATGEGADADLRSAQVGEDGDRLPEPLSGGRVGGAVLVG